MNSYAGGANVERCVKGRLAAHLLCSYLEDCHVEHTRTVLHLLVMCRSNSLRFFLSSNASFNKLLEILCLTDPHITAGLSGGVEGWLTDVWWDRWQNYMEYLFKKDKENIDVTIGDPYRGQNLPTACQCLFLYQLACCWWVWIRLRCLDQKYLTFPFLREEVGYKDTLRRSSSTVSLQQLFKNLYYTLTSIEVQVPFLLASEDNNAFCPYG